MDVFRVTPSSKRGLLWPRWFVEIACLADPKDLCLFIAKAWAVLVTILCLRLFGLLLGSVIDGVLCLLLISILRYIGNGWSLPENWTFWKQTVQGKTCVVTGCTSGLGHETVKNLIEWRAAHICMVSRNSEKLATCMMEFKSYARYLSSPTTFSVVACDFQDIKSIHGAAKKVAESTPKVDLLIANAGILNTKGYTQVDKFSTLEWTTNHLGTYAFCNMMMPFLRAAGSEKSPSRLVVLGSLAHLQACRELYNGERWTGANMEHYIKHLPKDQYKERVSYAFSKMCNMMFANALHRKMELTDEKRVQVYSVHPGSCKTFISRKDSTRPKTLRQQIQSQWKNFIRELTYKDLRTGIQTTMFCASAPKTMLMSGEFYAECSRSFVHPNVLDEEAQDRLVQVSDDMLKEAGCPVETTSSNWLETKSLNVDGSTRSIGESGSSPRKSENPKTGGTPKTPTAGTSNSQLSQAQPGKSEKAESHTIDDILSTCAENSPSVLTADGAAM